MNKDTLRSSIKAYCLELMKETSTSGGAGGYLTKKAFRSTKKQDLKSPTGFETSPNPNMYTKTMKFKIVKPKERLNSKDLWKEIKVNSPIRKARITSGDGYDVLVYRSGIKYQDNPEEIDKSLMDQKLYYDFDDEYKNSNTFSLISFIDGDDKKRYWWTDEEIDYKLKEIIVNNPNLITLDWKGIDKLIQQGYNINEKEVEDILDSYAYPSYGGKKEWWDETDNRDKQNLIRDLNKIISQHMNESRYTQFKQQTSKPKPKEILHKAIKEIQFKLDEVNRLIEFTTRIKGELTEGEQEIEYLKRTKNSIYKIYEKLKEAFEKISSIDEIRVNQPTKTWDFTRFIPNLDLKKIQVKDKIKLENGKEFTVDDFYIDHNVEDIIFIDKEGTHSVYGMNLAATNRWNEKIKSK